MSAWDAVIIEPTKIMLSQVGGFITKLVAIIVILVIGWLIARLIQNIIVRALKAVQLDGASERINIDKVLAKGGIKYTLSELIGVLCYWILMLIVFAVAMNAANLTTVSDLLNRIVLYTPNVIVSIFILILGMFVANFLAAVVQTATTNAGIEQSRLLGKVVQSVVVVFAVLFALEQLRIAPQTINLVISIILASLGLGLALAFGLGCKDMVGRAVADFIEKFKRK
jgi:hypothetical protein